MPIRRLRFNLGEEGEGWKSIQIIYFIINFVMNLLLKEKLWKFSQYTFLKSVIRVIELSSACWYLYLSITNAAWVHTLY